ncbi:MAG: hypothetical protein NVSMB57_10740 [Actinomycetota bacterium]
MRCESLRPYLTAYACHELQPHTREWVGSHLSLCAECSAIVERSSRVAASLQSIPQDSFEPPPGLADAVMARITQSEIPLIKRKLLPIPFVAGEQIGRLPAQVGRFVSENRETVIGVAGGVALTAGALWLARRTLRPGRMSPPARA